MLQVGDTAAAAAGPADSTAISPVSRLARPLSGASGAQLNDFQAVGQLRLSAGGGAGLQPLNQMTNLQ